MIILLGQIHGGLFEFLEPYTVQQAFAVVNDDQGSCYLLTRNFNYDPDENAEEFPED